MLFSNNYSHCIPEAIILKKTFCAFPINFVWTNVDHLSRGNLCIFITFSNDFKNCSMSSEKVAKTLSPLTYENCPVFPSSRQPQFQLPLSLVTSIHTYAHSLVLLLQASLSPNLASLFVLVPRSLSSLLFLLFVLLLLSASLLASLASL